MKAHYGQEVSAVQVAPSQLLVECHNSGILHSIDAEIQIRGTWVSKVGSYDCRAGLTYAHRNMWLSGVAKN